MWWPPMKRRIGLEMREQHYFQTYLGCFRVRSWTLNDLGHGISNDFLDMFIVYMFLYNYRLLYLILPFSKIEWTNWVSQTCFISNNLFLNWWNKIQLCFINVICKKCNHIKDNFYKSFYWYQTIVWRNMI